MKLKEKISLEKVFEKEYKIKLIELESNKEAVITHFLHNSKNGASHFFKKDAVKYTKEILQYEYPKEEISNIVAEEALQYGIFDTYDVGFEDTRGTLFFDVAEIIKRKQPKAIFLENVKGLRNHNGGKTLATILNVLRNDLGYFVPEPQIVNAKDFGVPQNRERIYIVGFHPSTNVTAFNYPKPLDKKVTFADIKEKENLGVTLKGRAFRSNLFVPSSQKGFPLQSLTQKVA